jgi:hypothetical protein
MFRLAAVFALTLLSLTIAIEAPAAKAQRCLRWIDIDTLTRHNQNSVLARSRSKGTYLIKFTGPCDYQRRSGDYFVMREQDRLSCISSLDVFQVHNAGACFIESVRPLTDPQPPPDVHTP